MKKSDCQRLIDNLVITKKELVDFVVDENNLEETKSQKEKVVLGIHACQNDIQKIVYDYFENYNSLSSGDVGITIIPIPKNNNTQLHLQIPVELLRNKGALDKQQLYSFIDNNEFDSILSKDASLVAYVLKTIVRNKIIDDVISLEIRGDNLQTTILLKEPT